MSDFKSPEDFTRWLMGEKMGEPTVRAWKWLWGIPSQPSPPDPTVDEITLADLERLLESMRLQLQQIEPIIDRVRRETAEIQRQSESKQQAYRELIDRVLAAKQDGNIAEARLLMARAVQVEWIFPELKVRWERSHQRLGELVEFQEQKASELALLSFDLQAVRTQIEINQSLDRHRHIHASPDLIALFDRFQQLGYRTDDLYREIQVLSQFDLSANCMLHDPETACDLDDRIDRLEANSGGDFLS
jgi:hypothetical protein